MKGLKKMGLAAIVGFAAASIVTKKLYEKKKDKELDEFLLPEEDETIVIHIESSLEDDMKQIKSSPVLFLFTMDSKEQAMLFQDLLAQKGLSSTIDVNTNGIEVMFNDEINEVNKSDLLKSLLEISHKTNAKYEGYHLK
ncbi:hypothetical protein [Floccifex sp.]|uniref:hypothetical protein n=1 Tax=Floccifex sp. TaxID=2815810 RepID=UPI003F048894